MNRILYILFLSAICGSSILQAQFTVSIDQHKSNYQVGEDILIRINSNQNAPISYTIKYDEKSTFIKQGILQATNGEAQLLFTPKESNVYLIEFTQNNNTDLLAIPVNINHLQAFEEEPADFDAFWDAAKTELAAVPIDAQLSIHRQENSVTTYRINLATIENRRVYGFISIPDGKNNMAAVLTLPPFGSVPNVVTPETFLAEQLDLISLTISIHDAEPDASNQNAYTPDIIDDADQLYYRLSVLAAIRAIDYLFTRPDFDGENLIINGVSQGGGLSILTAGLDERVSVLAFSNAALCQHSGMKYHKASGFPYYVYRSRAQFGDLPHEIATIKASKYLDAVYAARRFKGTTLATISLEDIVCPAATVFSAYNQIKGKKMVVESHNLGHDTPNDYWTGRLAFFRQQIPKLLDEAMPWERDTGHYINAGENQTVNSNAAVILQGEVGYNGISNSDWSVQWELVEGPASISITNAQNRVSSAQFPMAGKYVLRLTSYDTSRFENEKKRVVLEDYVEITVQ